MDQDKDFYSYYGDFEFDDPCETDLVIGNIPNKYMKNQVCLSELNDML